MTWEEKIESLVKLAKAVGRFTNTDRGTTEYKVTREHLFAAYDEFCEWRHDEPYVVDEIKALIAQPKEYIDRLTGICLIVERDIPEHPIIYTLICDEHKMLSIEQINEAIDRLRQRAGIYPSQLPDLKPVRMP